MAISWQSHYPIKQLTIMIASLLTIGLILYLGASKIYEIKSSNNEREPLLDTPLHENPVEVDRAPFTRYILSLLLLVLSALQLLQLNVWFAAPTIALAFILPFASYTPVRSAILFFSYVGILSINVYEFYKHESKLPTLLVLSLTVLVALYNWSCHLYAYHTLDYSTKVQPSTEMNATVFQLATFKWFTPLVNTGFKASLTMDDIYDLNPQDKALRNTTLFSTLKSNRHFLITLFHAVKSVLLKQVLFSICGALITFSGPYFLNRILEYLQNPSSLPHYMPFLFLVMLFVLSISKSMCDGQTYFLGRRVGTRVRSILIAEIYNKALTRKSTNTSVGEIVNLMSSDVQKCLDYVCYLHMLITTPLQIIICTIALYTFLGWSAISGILIMVIIIPIQRYLAQVVENQQTDLMKQTDLRINQMNEVLSGIRIIKFFSWENRFKEKLLNQREVELTVLRRFLLTVALMTVVYHAIPILVSLCTFISFAKIANGVLTPTNVFTTISLFYTLRMPLYDIPDQFVRYFETSVSVVRIARFLNEEDISRPMALDYVGFKDATFEWDNFTLNHLNIQFPINKLTVIVGSTGSGKSSLLSALLGEMALVDGEYSLPSNVAYVPQQSWLMNATIRDNIIFNNPFNYDLYQSVLYDTALLSDLQQLPGSDLTEVGEKGINLSGGQKQRIALARALYANKSICLLDDVLSAVDAPTQKHLFENCILQMKSTRILVSHSVGLVLPRADHIVVMKEGHVIAQGTLNHILSVLSPLDIEQLNIPTNTDYAYTTTDQLEKTKELAPQSIETKGTSIIQDEEQAVGNVSMSIYVFYMSASGGLFLWFMLLLGNVSSQFMNIGQDYWLKNWASAYTQHELNVNHYMYTYIAIGTTNICVQLLFMVIQFLGSIKASRLIHELLLTRILKAPISFFDATPLGRILNRFSRDIQVIDREVSSVLSWYLYNGLGTISILILISCITPLFLVAILPISVFYYLISAYYLKSSRELKRLDATTRSPIYAHFSTTLTGAHVIRAYQAEEMFKTFNLNKIDVNHRAFFYLWVSNRWLQVRTDALGALVVFAAGLAILLYPNMDAGLAGLSLSYALTFTDSVMWLVRYNALVEMNLNSVERVQEYMAIEQEAPSIIENKRPTSSWPWRGEIRCKGLEMRYSNNIVLKSITFTVYPREKIGIVGRTGAGKSTLAIAFFRMMEASKGLIEIDGINIADIGLQDLRSALTIIPQEPVLFKGTIKSNLDPFEEFDDLDVWNTIKRIKLNVDDLQQIVEENGSNFSVGERQLISLGRALLKRSRVIIMDEATASVDTETDKQIQQTIRSEFDDSTILCIAHRLKTVVDFNRIMVLDKGEIVEFDTPYNLLSRENGWFRKMCLESGEMQYLQEQAYKGKDLNIVGSFRSMVSDDYNTALQARFGSQ